ncbi:RNA-binding protein 15 [Aphelenchoides avenae]|nr:RNA-binding protein 15 [Aphelenchus avenae]
MDKNLRDADVLLSSATIAGGPSPMRPSRVHQQRSAAVESPASSSYGPQHFHNRPGRPPVHKPQPQPHQRQPQQQQRPTRHPEYRSMKSEDLAEVTVSSLSPDLTEDMLLSEFRVFGEIRSVEVRRKGDVSFGCLNFARRDDAKRAVLEMDGQVLGKGEVKVTLKQTAELTVNFLPPETTPTQLAKIFEAHGEVV